MSDGELDQAEQELILTIIVDIEKYNKLLEEALEDGVIDTVEEKQLFEGRMAIMEKAYSKAREDLVIDDQEKKILKEICRIVKDLH